MKNIILITLLIVMSFTSYSQCNCDKIYRDDGTAVTQCIPLPVAYDNNTQVGIAAASNGQDKFITVTVRFKSAAQNIKGNLTIRLENNNLITLEIVNTQLADIGNSQLAQAVFRTNVTDITKFKSSKLKTISLKLQDNILRTYRSTSNSNILIKQIQCL